MPEAKKARAVGFNHVALEVGDIDEALAFYGRLFDFTLRGKSADMAFIDLGDQFLALQKGRRQAADDTRADSKCGHGDPPVCALGLAPVWGCHRSRGSGRAPDTRPVVSLSCPLTWMLSWR